MPGNRKTVRAGGTSLAIYNSGNEVWIYDDANREAIRKPRGTTDMGAGGMPPDFDTKTAEGLIVGYSLMQDDELDVEVHVGDAFTAAELGVGRWLEPQIAFLRVPSGSLCIEPNDGSRIGPEDPTDKGAVVKVPPGEHRLTLYRIDHEALDREGLEWQGAQELILLTPDGKPSEAASGLLPFEPRRDSSWVGQYEIGGKTAKALIWFEDYWDTFTLNLDSAAIRKLAITPGTYIRTQVPATGHTFISVFANSWEDAQRLPRPAGIAIDEYGFAAAPSPKQDWNGAEAMFCRRDRAKTVVEDKHHTTWLPCTVEVLDAKPEKIEATAHRFIPAQLREKNYYEGLTGEFLSLILSEVLPDVADLEEFPLTDAVDRLDEAFAQMKLKAVADVSWEQGGMAQSALPDQKFEITSRLYCGRPDCFAAVIAREGTIDIVLLTERKDGNWLVTGLADDLEREVRHFAARRPKGPVAQVQPLDEDLGSILEAHQERLEDAEVASAPTSSDQAEAAFRRFVATAFG